MKKLMFTAAVAAAGLAFGIESANTVGYTTREINNKFVIAAGQFDAVGGNAFPVANVGVEAPATVNAWITWDDEADEFYDNVPGWSQKAPQIQIPNADGTGYTLAYYVADARNPADDSNAGAGWVSGDGYLINATITSGLGMWTRGYKDGDTTVGNTTLTYAGEVSDDDSQNLSLNDKFQLRAVPYPKELVLNGTGVADWSALTPGTAWITWDDEADEFYDNVPGWTASAPQIQIPNADNTGYTLAYYVADARDPADDSNAGAGWVSGDGYLINATIPVGRGVWFNGRKTVNLPIYK